MFNPAWLTRTTRCWRVNGHPKKRQYGGQREQDYRKEIEEIMGRLTCPKDFKCYKSGLDDLCKAQDVGLEEFLECLEENPLECTFSVHYGAVFYCRCPLRVYIVKKFGK